MQKNILRKSDVSTIYLVFTDGMRKKQEVSLRFMDDKECYLSMPASQQFVKPKKKMAANLIAYTVDGVYTADVKIMDTMQSTNEIMYIVNIPKGWKYTQLRASTRKEVHIPFSIKFNDGYEIKGETENLSLGGIAFYYQDTIPSMYQKLNGVLTFKLPDNVILNFEHGELNVETKFLRSIRSEEYMRDDICYVYKFLSMSHEDINVLKSFLIYL